MEGCRCRWRACHDNYDWFRRVVDLQHELCFPRHQLRSQSASAQSLVSILLEKLEACARFCLFPKSDLGCKGFPTERSLMRRGLWEWKDVCRWPASLSVTLNVTLRWPASPSVTLKTELETLKCSYQLQLNCSTVLSMSYQVATAVHWQYKMFLLWKLSVLVLGGHPQDAWLA